MGVCSALLMVAACQKEEEGPSETISRTYFVSFSEMSGMSEPVWSIGNQLYFADDFSTKSGTQVIASDALIADGGASLQEGCKGICDKCPKRLGQAVEKLVFIHI